jgi:uncharacterized protein (TIGR03435 family)
MPKLTTRHQLLPILLAVASIASHAQSAPPPAHQPMTEQNPSFAVATLKPSDPAQPGKYFRVFGRTYETHGTSLADLIQVAYGVNPKQIVKAPAWVRDDKFDLHAIPDAEGDPDGKQWLAMMRKLLTDRFSLTLHHEQQPLSTYVLTVAKDGPKNLTPSQSTRPLPSLEFNRTSAGLVLPARNAAMGQFCQMLQQAVLDRPVVDHTGLTGNFDFTLTFTPDESQFNGHPPIDPTKSDAPSLFEALQQQLGLKLTAEQLPTDVLVIDHAQQPTPN